MLSGISSSVSRLTKLQAPDITSVYHHREREDPDYYASKSHTSNPEKWAGSKKDYGLKIFIVVLGVLWKKLELVGWEYVRALSA